MSDSTKEKILEEYPCPVTMNCTNIILEQMKNCICKIINIANEGTGFFCHIPRENINLMITNNHVINEEILKKNSKLEVSLNDGIEKIEIDLNNKKLYTSQEYDVTIIEVNEDKIKYYIDLDESIFEENKNLYNKSIYILQYFKYNLNEMKLAVSYGIIKELTNEFNINHLCNINKGSLGSPILDISNNKVIGIHTSSSKTKNFNIGTYLKHPINEYLNNKNLIKKDSNILITLNIKKEDINEEIYFLNENKNYLKELNESNTELFINEIKYKYKKYFKPEKEGIYEIKLKFHNNIKDCSFMFSNCKKIIKIDLSSFDSSCATDMNNMFSLCKNITSLDLSSFDTNNVTNMNHMFHSCLKLTYLNLSSFNTNNVTDMSYMFYLCQNITNLNLSSFDTNNVTNMNHMFSLCEKIINLNLSSFDTNKVTNMSYMFHYCENIRDLKLFTFDTRNVTRMDRMFYNCTNIASLDLSSFNTEKVTNMNYMFYGCINLGSLELSSFDTRNIVEINSMFYNCKKITKLILSFDTKKVKDMSYIFYGCNNLTHLNLSSFDTQNVLYMDQMFYDCNHLINLDLSNFNSQNALISNEMFYNCKNLKKVKLKKTLNEKILDELTKLKINVIIIDEK